MSGSHEPGAALPGELAARLDAASLAALGTAAELAAASGARLYLVGGAVRDLLRGGGTPDLDLVVEGDGLELARRLAAALGAALESHPAFLTATVRLPGGAVLDVASSRRESYPRPGALPRVEPAPLADDLARRDFTVNAMALRLEGAAVGELHDPHGGRADLERGWLRVLHPGSFGDDPTRILRGLRLEARLGLRFSPDTEQLAVAALATASLSRLSAERLRGELLPLLAAARPELVARWGELGLGAALDPEIEPGSAAARLGRWQAAGAELAAASAEGADEPDWRLAWLALSWESPLEARRRAVGRLALGSAAGLALSDAPERLRERWQRLAAPALAAHQAAALTRGLEWPELAIVAAEGGAAGRRWARRELVDFRRLTLGISGSDLVAHGFAEGPAIGRALEATRAARLDGEIDAAEELAYALALLAEAQPRAAAGEEP